MGCRNRLKNNTKRHIKLRPFFFFLNQLSFFEFSIFTLDDKTEAKTAKRQVSKHWLLLRLANDVTFRLAAAQLEGQSELGRLDIFFYLKEKFVWFRTANWRVQEKFKVNTNYTVLELKKIISEQFCIKDFTQQNFCGGIL